MNGNSLSGIRKDLELHIGEKVWLKANRGRRKALVKEGILECTYPYHFLVRLGDLSNASRLSVSYADILTQAVELCVGAPEQRLALSCAK